MECVVCKRSYKKRGLKIHQKKSGCYKKLTDPHRKVYKSVVPNIQENNHSEVGHQADQEGRAAEAGRREERRREAMEQKEKHQKPKEKEPRLKGEDNDGNQELGGGDLPDESGKREEERHDSEELEIHVDGTLYDEVHSWLDKTVKEVKEEISTKKRVQDIRGWFKTERETVAASPKKSEQKSPKAPAKVLTKGRQERRTKAKWDPRKTSEQKQTTLSGDVKERSIRSTEANGEDTRRVLIRDHGTGGAVEKEVETEGTLKAKSSMMPAKDSRKVLLKERQDIRGWFGSEMETGGARTCVEEGGDQPGDTRKVIKEGTKGPDQVNIKQGPSKEVLAKHGLHLTRGDFRSLSGQNYLNDKIIEEYLRLIAARNEEDPQLPSVHVCSVFLYKQLAKFGLEEGCRRTRNWIKEDITTKDKVLFPIHSGEHWTLIVVEPDKKTVQFLDSLTVSRNFSSAPRTIKAFMESRHREKGEEAEYRIKIREDIPKQTNGVDCGVFVCQYAERITRKAMMDFQQEDMREERKTMTTELLEGKLKPQEQRCKAHARKKEQKGEKKGKPEKKRERKGHNEELKYEKEITGESSTERIKWPKSNSKEWERLDENLTTVLKAQSASPESKATMHPVIIYTLCKERFGLKERKEKSKSSGPSKRQKKCTQLRNEINKLKEAVKNAAENEKEAIKELQDEKLKKLRLAKRAETLKKARKTFTRNCNAFLSHPYDFARSVIAPKPKGNLKSSKEEVETHLRTAHERVKEEESRENTVDMYEYSEPEVEFDDEPPSWNEFNKRLRKTRNKSAPGPNGVPYIVYKKCPGVAKLLWGYLKGLWRKNSISKEWRKAEGIFIPKEEGAEDVGKFRTISLLNVEGKLFFGMKADRLAQFAMANGRIDTSIQKGGVPGMAGCLEHTAVISQLIREAKEGKGDLVVTWLDIANAYGSLPHEVIMTALKNAHVPDQMCKLVESYYADVKIRFSTKDFTTEWQQVEKGIITGCTLSVILFALAMTMIVMSVKDETKGPKSASGQQQVNSRLFMDDIATTTGNLVQTKHLLDRMDEKLSGAGLEVKTEKCRSLVIIKGEVSKKTPSIGGKPITSITEKPVKYLGKQYNSTLTEKEQIEETMKELKRSLRKIEKCKVPGRYKAWMIQHMLLPRLMWPLTIYNFPSSKVEAMQRRITAKLKKWLGIPKTLSVDCMYTRSGKLQLPFTELSEEHAAAKARLLTMLRDSEDQGVKGAEVKVDGGRKANTQASLEDAESRLRMQEVAGNPNRGKEGLGSTPRTFFSKATRAERRTMIVDTVREAEEEKRVVRMAGLAKQGAHMRWEVPERKLGDRELVTMADSRFSFLVKAVYDLLPTPHNKHLWFGEEEGCELCGARGTLQHILTGCKVALCQGRYKWRHDQVLREIAQGVDQRRMENNRAPREEKGGISFVKAGFKGPKSKAKTRPRCYLDGAADWQLQVDLDGKLKVPVEVADTHLRPDMLLLSRGTRRMGIIELTVPSEERIEVSSELKKMKYEGLKIEGRSNGWAVTVWAVEVGCRGFPASSLATFLKDIGIGGGERRRRLKGIGETAERASKSIWNWSRMKERGQNWDPVAKAAGGARPGGYHR